jgi:hypothetical protein
VLHEFDVISKQIIEVTSNLINRIFVVCLRQISYRSGGSPTNQTETDVMRASVLACLHPGMPPQRHVSSHHVDKAWPSFPLVIKKAEKGVSLTFAQHPANKSPAFMKPSEIQFPESRLSSRSQSSLSTTQHWRQLAFYSPLGCISVADSCCYPTDRHAITTPP